MPNYKQADRRLVVSTPLGENTLLLEGFSGVEALSEPFAFQLQLASERSSIDPKSIIGQPVSFGLQLGWPTDAQASIRWFHGIVRRFAYRGGTDRLTRYAAEVVPSQWFLQRRTDARIYQSAETPAIVQDVIARARAGELDTKDLAKTYPKREYCVQYRETDHDFISRLLEDEGIFYRYARGESGHVMRLGDSVEDYVSCTSHPLHRSVPFQQPHAGDDILSWERVFDFQPGRWVMRDYNFLTPSAPLEADRNLSTEQAGAERSEMFHYPGGYQTKAEGQRLVRARMESDDCQYDIVMADTVCPDLFPGGRFKVGRHPVPGERDREWLVVKVEHVVHGDGEFETGSGRPIPYANRVTCIPADVLFRPARRTLRPVMHGVQTAVVVGPNPKGSAKPEEIYVDKHGRVKVHFHWDRHGAMDDSASCWIRVAQPWAGAGYGSLAIPRIGQEVLVEFEEGNPDRPIINGSLYNAGQPVPVSTAGGRVSAKDITEAAMNTTLRSNSLGGTGGHNEITMNDREDAEVLFVKAQKDSITQVGHDATTSIGANATLDIGGESKVAITKHSTTTVGGDETHKITGEHWFEVTGGSDIVVYEGHTITAKSITIGTVDDFKMSSRDSVVELEAAKHILLKCGQSQVKLEPDGTITVTGLKIGINGMAEVNLACGANYMKIDPSGVTIFGTLVKIN
jgi:type VI secretion system secreted protein VgrG